MSNLYVTKASSGITCQNFSDTSTVNTNRLKARMFTSKLLLFEIQNFREKICDLFTIYDLFD